MSKISAVMIGLSVIAIGLGVPAICLYAGLFHSFNYVAVALVTIAAIVMAGGIAVVGIVMGPLGKIFDDSSRYEKQRLRTLRDHQKATLEELDDIIDVLGEIRDVLKSVEE